MTECKRCTKELDADNEQTHPYCADCFEFFALTETDWEDDGLDYKYSPEKWA